MIATDMWNRDTMPVKFWLIWREGGHMPTRKHASFGSALEEAERLTKENPEVRFHVLQNEAYVESRVEVIARRITLQ